MSAPDYVLPFIGDVWSMCDPEWVISSRYYSPENGLPPSTLRVYEAADANWARGHCDCDSLRAWIFDGSSFTDIEPAPYHADEGVSIGMYWHPGVVRFCLDLERRMAVYEFVLGPKYGEGYRRRFGPDEPVSLEREWRFRLWIS